MRAGGRGAANDDDGRLEPGPGRGDPDQEEVLWLDAEGEADGEDLVWLDAEGIGSGPSAASLPPPTTRARILVTLLVLGLAATGVGSTAVAAYHRHVTDVRAAAQLDLLPTADAPYLPDLAGLGFQRVWHEHVTEPVAVAVINSGPRPVRLLGAALREPGLLAPATLSPAGDPVLAPGATGRLSGAVTADCSQGQIAVAAVVSVGGGRAQSDATEGAISGLEVHARTLNGRTATALVDPDGDGPLLQQRICSQQGYDVAGPAAVAGSADPGTHTLRFTVTVPIRSDVPLDYSASATYVPDPIGLPGAVLPNPYPVGRSFGTAAPGSRLTVEFAIDLGRCPSRPLPAAYSLDVTTILQVGDAQIEQDNQVVALEPLVAAACAPATG